MKVFHMRCSSVFPTPPMEPLNLSTLTMITDAESSLRREWDKKLRLIHLEKSSRDISLELMVALIRMDLLWSRESSATIELDYFSHQALQAIESREKEREKEDLSEDASLDLILRLFHSPLSRRERRRSQDLLMIPDPEDLVLKEPQESESYTVLKK